MIFTETRGNDGTRDADVSFASALLSPVASFGGIYSPETMSPLDADFLDRHLNSSYKQLALALLQHLNIDIEEAVKGATGCFASNRVTEAADEAYKSFAFQFDSRIYREPFEKWLSSLPPDVIMV